VPATRPGGVLVRTHFSLISTGTEMMKINESKLSLVGKARARPDQVKKVIQPQAACFSTRPSGESERENRASSGITGERS
jgi:hypothetical protein